MTDIKLPRLEPVDPDFYIERSHLVALSLFDKEGQPPLDVEDLDSAIEIANRLKSDDEVVMSTRGEQRLDNRLGVYDIEPPQSVGFGGEYALASVLAYLSGRPKR